MRRYYTAESVTEGHPDKVCDQIADAILDECLKHDPSSRVACEVLATRGNVFVAGEISSGYEPPVFDVIRKVLGECGYCTDGIEMDTFVHQQSPDIAKAVSVSKEFRDNNGKKGRDRSRGAGDQGVMVGYACDETAQLIESCVSILSVNTFVRKIISLKGRMVERTGEQHSDKSFSNTVIRMELQMAVIPSKPMTIGIRWPPNFMMRMFLYRQSEII